MTFMLKKRNGLSFLDLFHGGGGNLSFMKKTVSLFLLAMLMFFVSCNGSTPEVSSSAQAPVPVFLKGISSQARSSVSNDSQDDLFRMYKYMIGGFALVGFDGTTGSSEIANVDVLGTKVDFTWTEENGVFTYEGTGEDMAIEITYNTKADLINLIQVSKGSAYTDDFFIVFKATGIKYNNAEKTLNGKYTAYLSMAMPSEDLESSDAQYSPFSIGYGYAHSDEDATGVLTTKMINLGDALKDDEYCKLDDPHADIETGDNLISMMEENKDEVAESINLQVLYALDGGKDGYFQFPKDGAYDSLDYLSEIKNQLNPVSSQWSDTLDDLFPDTSQQYL